MGPDPSKTEPETHAKLPREALDHWLRVVHRLPEVRLEKVMAVRDALRENRYDTELMLDRTIDRLRRDVGDHHFR